MTLVASLSFLKFITIYGFCFSLSLLTDDDYQDKSKKLGICLTEALKFVILIGIFLSIEVKTSTPNVFYQSLKLDFSFSTSFQILNVYKTFDSNLRYHPGNF